jgi:hypothetical protein
MQIRFQVFAWSTSGNIFKNPVKGSLGIKTTFIRQSNECKVLFVQIRAPFFEFINAKPVNKIEKIFI